MSFSFYSRSSFVAAVFACIASGQKGSRNLRARSKQAEHAVVSPSTLQDTRTREATSSSQLRPTPRQDHQSTERRTGERVRQRGRCILQLLTLFVYEYWNSEEKWKRRRVTRQRTTKTFLKEFHIQCGFFKCIFRLSSFLQVPNLHELDFTHKV